MDNWVVQIVESETGNVVKEIECGDERRAERIERGVMINLNHDQFHTQLVNKSE